MYFFILIFLTGRLFSDIIPKTEQHVRMPTKIQEPRAIREKMDSKLGYQISEQARFEAQGINTENMIFYQNQKRTRGFVTHTKWTVTDPTDGKIVIPFSFHQDFPTEDETKVIDIMARMNDDLGKLS
mgnify:CR=1 FL=1